MPVLLAITVLSRLPESDLESKISDGLDISTKSMTLGYLYSAKPRGKISK